LSSDDLGISENTLVGWDPLFSRSPYYRNLSTKLSLSSDDVGINENKKGVGNTGKHCPTPERPGTIARSLSLSSACDSLHTR